MNFKPGSILLLWVLFTLSGCVSLREPNATPDLPASLPEAAQIQGVPFFPQQASLCGPAALATVLSHSGVDVTPEVLIPQVYTPVLKGSLQLDLIGATRHAGLVPYLIAPSLAALFEEIAAGNPVLVLQRVGILEGDWHFAVVVGFNRPAGQVTLRSGPAMALQMPLAQFDQSWSESGRWGLIASAPEQIPASASETHYLKQIAALESIRPDMARTAYQASLRRWPNSLTALMGLGNLAYDTGQYAEAARYFYDASNTHPDAGDAFNNLAQTYAREQKWTEAEDAIRRALALRGNHIDIYRRTHDEITRARLAEH
ncbi:MAG: PA2778 family cysteine peptidase [Burkholderiales bacterium]|nr:PA2778 family cysteine peptidase [Ferrovum sp.]